MRIVDFSSVALTDRPTDRPHVSVLVCCWPVCTCPGVVVVVVVVVVVAAVVVVFSGRHARVRFNNLPNEDARAEARRRVLDVIADGYRSNWDILSSTRRVLGICPNVMVCGPGDVGEGYGMPRGGQGAVLTQEARRAFTYYQRQLWDPYVVVVIVERRTCMLVEGWFGGQLVSRTRA